MEDLFFEEIWDGTKNVLRKVKNRTGYYYDKVMSKIKSSYKKFANGMREIDIYVDNTYDKYSITVADFSKKAILYLEDLRLSDALNDIVGVCTEYKKQIKVIDNITNLVIKIKGKEIPQNLFRESCLFIEEQYDILFGELLQLQEYQSSPNLYLY